MPIDCTSGSTPQDPGTKVSISEYGWGDPRNFITALATVDVLGIFGRERVDLACISVRRR